MPVKWMDDVLEIALEEMPEQGSNDDDNAVGMKDVSGKTDKEDTKNRINPH